jgi:hypothetical protein
LDLLKSSTKGGSKPSKGAQQEDHTKEQQGPKSWAALDDDLVIRSPKMNVRVCVCACVCAASGFVELLGGRGVVC